MSKYVHVSAPTRGLFSLTSTLSMMQLITSVVVCFRPHQGIIQFNFKKMLYMTIDEAQAHVSVPIRGLFNLTPYTNPNNFSEAKYSVFPSPSGDYLI